MLYFLLPGANNLGAQGNETTAFSRKGTTTNRHDAKMATTFCVFLLTGFLQKLILRFQIRGSVEAPGGPSRGSCGSACSHETSPGSKQKNRARSPAPRPHRGVKRCCEGRLLATGPWRRVALRRTFQASPAERG